MKLNKCVSGGKIQFRVIALQSLTLRMMLSLFLGVWANAALADVSCSFSASSVTLNAGTITVQRDIQSGSVLSSVIMGPQLTMTCNSRSDPGSPYTTTNLQSNYPASTSLPGYNGNAVFSVPVNGIVSSGLGVTLGLWVEYSGLNYIPIGSNSYAGPGLILNPNSSQWHTSSRLTSQQAQLIKTGDSVISGAISAHIADVKIQRYQAGTLYATLPVYLTATINALSCSVSTPNVNVVLPTVNAGSFTGIGTTLGDMSFSVGLQCDAGARVNATMNFSQDSDTPDQSVAAVTGKGNAGVASGVGIQLLYGSTPLKNNTMTLLKTSSGGMELPAGAFSARYFQTKNTVQPGTANTTATMTLTYQ